MYEGRLAQSIWELKTGLVWWRTAWNFRDGVATGRLLEPVIRPRGAFCADKEQSPDGRRAPKTLAAAVDYRAGAVRAAEIGAERESPAREHPIVHFEGRQASAGIFGCGGALADKHR